MPGKDSLRSANDQPLSTDNLCLCLIEALQDTAVIEKIKEITRKDREEIADLAVQKYAQRIKRLEDHIAAQDKKIKDMEEVMNSLEAKLDDQEQYSRRTSVRISGIKETPTENVREEATKVFTTLGLNPSINRIHRVGPKAEGTVRPVLVQFTDFPDKDAVMKKRRDLSTKMPNIFINEDLTRKRSKIMYEARRKKREGNIKGVWSADGRICIQDNEKIVHYITTLRELNHW